MTIDEVIAQARSDEEFSRRKVETDCVTGRTYLHPFCEYIKRAEEQKHLAEWLEELKSYRAHIFSGDMTQAMLKEVYDKAIDDFVRFANTMPTVESEDGTIRPMWLEEIAEQLKVGGNNDA